MTELYLRTIAEKISKMSKIDAGQYGWHVIHSAAQSYPLFPKNKHRDIAKAIIATVINNFPCQNCRNHAIAYITENPVNLDSNIAFQKWAFKFHNDVNARLGKPIFTWSQYLIQLFKK